MYAVIKSGGKQYKVQEGDTIRVEKINTEEGGEISLDEVLMVADGDNVSVGAPVVEGASVAATVEITWPGRKNQGRSSSSGVNITANRWVTGRHYTELKITGINTQ